MIEGNHTTSITYITSCNPAGWINIERPVLVFNRQPPIDGIYVAGIIDAIAVVTNRQ